VAFFSFFRRGSTHSDTIVIIVIIIIVKPFVVAVSLLLCWRLFSLEITAVSPGKTGFSLLDPSLHTLARTDRLVRLASCNGMRRGLDEALFSFSRVRPVESRNRRLAVVGPCATTLMVPRRRDGISSALSLFCCLCHHHSTPLPPPLLPPC
jgi:hypothetical protein